MTGLCSSTTWCHPPPLQPQLPQLKVCVVHLSLKMKRFIGLLNVMHLILRCGVVWWRVPVDNDFEYTMCEEMTMEGSWAQWLTEDKDGDTRDDE